MFESLMDGRDREGYPRCSEFTWKYYSSVLCEFCISLLIVRVWYLKKKVVKEIEVYIS